MKIKRVILTKEGTNPINATSSVSMEETANGVRVNYGGSAEFLVPWHRIYQVDYAPRE